MYVMSVSSHSDATSLILVIAGVASNDRFCFKIDATTDAFSCSSGGKTQKYCWSPTMILTIVYHSMTSLISGSLSPLLFFGFIQGGKFVSL